MGCCIETIDGAPPGGGGSSPLASQGVLVTALDGTTVTGTTNTSVCIWSGASVNLGTVALGDWLTRVDDAVLGSSFALAAGIYDVRFVPVMLNAADAVIGISYNASGAQLTGAPVGTQPAFAGRIDFRQPTGISVLQADGVIQVTEADVTAGTNLIRTHITNVGVAPAPAVVIVAVCAFTINRVGESA